MERKDVLVAGHICLDIIPEVGSDLVFEPGRLVEIGPATLSTGGAVSNTGLSLAIMGVSTSLVGRVGGGILGRAVLEVLESHAPGSSASMSVAPGEHTSYTIVLNLKGSDRMFLHSPGANVSFCSGDVSDEALERHRWMHLGYPPLLRGMYLDGGLDLENLFRRAKSVGSITSLDLSLPDPQSESGRADWGGILARVLPHVDFFMPSIEELVYMLDRTAFEAMDPIQRSRPQYEFMEPLIDRCLALGAGHVVLKLGDRGLLLRAGRSGRSSRGAPCWESWEGRTVWHPAYRVDSVGTTGAGDATIAGFILGCLRGFDPIAACSAAVAAGAYCCERPDAIGGLRSWSEIEKRIDAGWPARSLSVGEDWTASGSAFVKEAP